jgi:hypothetical protein
MKKSLLLFCCLGALNCFAQVDYNVKGVVRSFPQAFLTRGELGYSFELYRKNPTFLFGYIRPVGTFKSSIFVNSSSVKLDFNPISFLNFYVGKSITYRRYEEFDTFDCRTLACSGNIERKIYGVRLALKHKKLFSLLALKYFDSDYSGIASKDYIDEIGTLVHSGQKSIMRQGQVILGFKWNEKLSLGALILHSQLKNNSQSSQMSLLFGRYQLTKKWQLMLGSGVFETRFDALVGSTLAVVSWTPQKGLPLF